MTFSNFNAAEAKKITAEAKLAISSEAEKLADKCVTLIMSYISKEASSGMSFFHCSLYTICDEVLHTFKYKELIPPIVKRKLRKLNFSISKSFNDSSSFYINW